MCHRSRSAEKIGAVRFQFLMSYPAVNVVLFIHVPTQIKGTVISYKLKSHLSIYIIYHLNHTYFQPNPCQTFENLQLFCSVLRWVLLSTCLMFPFSLMAELIICFISTVYSDIFFFIRYSPLLFKEEIYILFAISAKTFVIYVI